MAIRHSKILIKRGTKESLERNIDTLLDNETVFAYDIPTMGVKRGNTITWIGTASGTGGSGVEYKYSVLDVSELPQADRDLAGIAAAVGEPGKKNIYIVLEDLSGYYDWINMGPLHAGGEGSGGSSYRYSVENLTDLPVAAPNLLGVAAAVGPEGSKIFYIVLEDENGILSWVNIGPIQVGPKGEDGHTEHIFVAYASSEDGSIDFSINSFEGAIFFGTYVSVNPVQSLNPSDYEWLRIKGEEGDTGPRGERIYLHNAYATSPDGSEGFSLTYTGAETYIGSYTDTNTEDSTIYTDYTWIKFKGEDGLNGADGKDGQDGADGWTTYFHIAYADGPDGENFNTVYFTGATYIGTYTDTEESDSLDPNDYEWKLFKGRDGEDGDPLYLHIAYANSPDGFVDFNTVYFEGARYVGTVSNRQSTNPTNYSEYQWALFKGEDGHDGADGADGTSVVIKGTVNSFSNLPSSATVGDLYIVEDEGDGYVWNGQSWDNVGRMKGDQGLQTFVHFAYSTSEDGVEDFSTTYFNDAAYIGTYTSTVAADSQNPLDYEWKRFVGEKGQDGAKGDTFYLHMAYANSVDGEQDFSVTYFEDAKYIGTYTSVTPTDSTNPSDYEWKKFRGDDGDNGADGTSVVLKGSVNEVGNLPSSADLGDLYVVTATGDGYVWNGSNWDNAGPIRGPQGQPGQNGQSAYIHYAYATNSTGTEGFSLTYTGTQTYIGVYTDSTQADSTNPTKYEWSRFVGHDGADGHDGVSTYLHMAYATNSTGTQGFSLTYTGIESFIGTYLDNVEADSTNPNRYEWKKFIGDDGDNGKDGTNAIVRGSVTTQSQLPVNNRQLGDIWIAQDTGIGWAWNGSAWTNVGTIRGPQGLPGSDGKDGTPITAKGEVLIVQNLPTAGVKIGDAWRVNSNGHLYVWNGTTWISMGKITGSDGKDGVDGQPGAPGQDGKDGQTYYLHIAYATSDTGVGFSLTVFNDATHLGTHISTNASPSSNPSVYTWKRIVGKDGPGLVFRGPYNTSEIYYYTDDKRDVVSRDGIYYVLRDQTFSPTTGTWTAGRWKQIEKYESVATELLLAKDATITNNLVMGDNSAYGTIRSYGKTSATTGTGFWLRARNQSSGSNEFSLGDSSQYLRWTNNRLSMITPNFSIDSSGNASFKGHVEAGTGKIGGFNIGSIQLSSGSGSSFVALNSSGEYAFWAGSHVPSSGKFFIKNNGQMKATSGNIGPWTFNNDRLYASGTKVIRPGLEELIYNNELRPERIQMSLSHLWYGSGGSVAYEESNKTIIDERGVVVGNNYTTDMRLNANGLWKLSRTGDTLSSLQLLAGSAYLSGNSGVYLSANNGSKIYVKGGNVDSYEALYNPNGGAFTSGHTQVSTKLVKENIEVLDPELITQFIETLDIKKFNYIDGGKSDISLIIEDEMLEGIPFQEELFVRDNGKYKYEKLEDIPLQLRPYIDTDNFTANDDGSYDFNPITYNVQTMLALSLAVNKQQHEEIKQLKNEIKDIKDHLGL